VLKNTVDRGESPVKKSVAFLLKHGLTAALVIALVQTGVAQPPGPGPGGRGAGSGNAPRMPMTMAPDPRVEQVTYRFEDTGEDLAYVRYVSSKVSKDEKAPLIVALHGLGGDGNFLLRDRLVDLAEEHGYIVVAPLGYNVSGWYGSPLISFGGGPVEPANLSELSEKDVMNVLKMTREQFNVDESRTYLLGHSMGGAGTLFLGQKHTQEWAALAAIAPAAFMMERNRTEILAPLEEAGVPLIIVQGDMDTAVPVANTRNWAESMKVMGLESRYVELAGGDHGTVIGDGMPDIFEFFAAHTKD
jgi:predicted peptidase